jgi:serine/threonine-protein kinase
MGRVFEAVDTVTGNRVAAKIMFARAEADPRSLLRFRQEGGLLASLHHPNIVRVHTTVVEEYASCIVMDLVEGRSLADIVAGERLSPARVKHIAAQIASALAAAHERGIVHRDIKPSNIMIGTDDHVTVTDFGIARLIRPSETAVTSTMTGTGMTLGTPLYMAPEQIQGEKVDGRADVYSLGAVLYHLVTGRPPFDDRDPVTIAYKHVHEPPPPPRAIRPDVPEDWEALVLRALAKAPDDRFQTAVAMAQAISELSVPAPKEEARDRTAGDIEHTAVPAPAPRPGFSARTAAGAFAAVLVVLLVAAGIARHAAGSGAGGGSPGTGPGQFSRPTGIQVDDAGNVYVVDEWNARVEEFDRVGTFVRQWGGTGSPLFRDPSDIARDPDTGVLYVSDFGSKRIVVIPPRGKTSVIPLNAGALAVGPNGTLFASNYGDHLIHRFARNGRELAPLSIPMVDVGSFNYPAGMAVDGLGRLYIADRLHDRIVRLSPDGSWSSIVGSGEGSKDGQLKFATDVALDTTLSPVGNIYVADTGNNRIQKFTPQGGFSESRHLGGSPIHGLNHPSSIAVDWQGDLYVSDYDHSRVIKLSAAGEPLWYTHGEKSVVLR